MSLSRSPVKESYGGIGLTNKLERLFKRISKKQKSIVEQPPQNQAAAASSNTSLADVPRSRGPSIAQLALADPSTHRESSYTGSSSFGSSSPGRTIASSLAYLRSPTISVVGSDFSPVLGSSEANYTHLAPPLARIPESGFSKSQPRFQIPQNSWIPRSFSKSATEQESDISDDIYISVLEEMTQYKLLIGSGSSSSQTVKGDARKCSVESTLLPPDNNVFTYPKPVLDIDASSSVNSRYTAPNTGYSSSLSRLDEHLPPSRKGSIQRQHIQSDELVPPRPILDSIRERRETSRRKRSSLPTRPRHADDAVNEIPKILNITIDGSRRRSEGDTPTTAIALDPRVDVGAGLVLSWLAGGRRFFDDAAVKKMKIPGSRCLAIDHSVTSFEDEFPLSELTIFRTPSVAAVTASRLCTEVFGLDYAELPFPDNHFDCVSARSAVISVTKNKWTPMLEEFKRVLKPGGHLELMCVDIPWLNEGPITASYSQKMTDCLEALSLFSQPSQHIPRITYECFGNADVAHLAMPILWGGQISKAWEAFFEPLRLLREETQCGGAWDEGETARDRWDKMKDEVLQYKSARSYTFVVATKKSRSPSIS